MIVLRSAKLSDAKDIFAAESAYIDCPWTFSQIEEEIADSNTVFVVAEENGTLAGYVSGKIIVDTCDVGNIAVVENYRRRGIGLSLINELLAQAEARGVTEEYLLVREDNAAAICLYERVGFKTVGKRAGYYKGKNAYTMARKIGSGN